MDGTKGQEPRKAAAEFWELRAWRQRLQPARAMARLARAVACGMEFRDDAGSDPSAATGANGLDFGTDFRDAAGSIWRRSGLSRSLPVVKRYWAVGGVRSRPGSCTCRSTRICRIASISSAEQSRFRYLKTIVEVGDGSQSSWYCATSSSGVFFGRTKKYAMKLPNPMIPKSDGLVKSSARADKPPTISSSTFTTSQTEPRTSSTLEGHLAALGGGGGSLACAVVAPQEVQK